MSTEIIKINCSRGKINEVVDSLQDKLSQNNKYQLTIIVQETTRPKTREEKSKLKSKKLILQTIDLDQNERQKKQDLQNDFQFIQSQNKISDYHDKSNQKQKKINSYKSLKSLENITNKPQKKKVAFQIQSSKIVSFNNKKKDHQNLVNIFTQTQQSPKDFQTLKISQNYNYNHQMHRKQEEQQLLSVNNENEERDSDKNKIQSFMTASVQDSDAGLMIENQLNQAIRFIQTKQVFQLQQFLYKFKQRNTFINMRTQTKWSLLMARCKQWKLQYERAATNYSQVIENIIKQPKMINVDIGNLYNRLGFCYYKLSQWNKGIQAYVKALNFYKLNRKFIQYANCINQLGSLYLNVGYFLQAEKCILMAYNIKRKTVQKRHSSCLVTTLFLLLQCNLKLKNLTQSQSILGKIIQQISFQKNPHHTAAYHIKRAFLQFYLNNFQIAQKHADLAFKILQNFPKQILQVEAFQILALINQQKGQHYFAKQYFSKAYNLLQKHVSIGNSKLQQLRMRIQINGNACKQPHTQLNFKYNTNKIKQNQIKQQPEN